MIYSLKITDSGIQGGSAGQAKAWFIKIRPGYKDDVGLLEHEKTHVKQFWCWGIFHILLYSYCAAYRQNCEVAAYRIQLKFSPDQLDWFAQRLSEMYNLNITQDDARKLLAYGTQ
jgi:hypothetical protein